MELQQAAQIVLNDASQASVPVHEATTHLQAAQVVVEFFNEYFKNEQEGQNKQQQPVPPKKQAAGTAKKSKASK